MFNAITNFMPDFLAKLYKDGKFCLAGGAPLAIKHNRYVRDFDFYPINFDTLSLVPKIKKFLLNEKDKCIEFINIYLSKFDEVYTENDFIESSTNSVSYKIDCELQDLIGGLKYDKDSKHASAKYLKDDIKTNLDLLNLFKEDRHATKFELEYELNVLMSKGRAKIFIHATCYYDKIHVRKLIGLVSKEFNYAHYSQAAITLFYKKTELQFMFPNSNSPEEVISRFDYHESKNYVYYRNGKLEKKIVDLKPRIDLNTERSSTTFWSRALKYSHKVFKYLGKTVAKNDSNYKYFHSDNNNGRQFVPVYWNDKPLKYLFIRWAMEHMKKESNIVYNKEFETLSYSTPFKSIYASINEDDLILTPDNCYFPMKIDVDKLLKEYNQYVIETYTIQ